MTSGISTVSTTTRRLGASLLWLILCSDPALAEPAAAVDAAAVVASLKRAVPARTAYTEVRFSGVLDRPLILRGELEYLGPGRLGKRVDTPYREQTTIADGNARVQRGDAPPRLFSLGQAPELEGFLRGFAALLGGDAVALGRDFSLAASGTGAAWRLSLKPLDPRLARRVGALDVDGRGNEPRCFTTHDADGDTDVLLVGPLATTALPNRPASSQLDALCRGAVQ